MATIISQPAASDLHGILPEKQGGTLIYTVSVTVTNGTIAPALTVNFVIGGVTYASMDLDGYTERIEVVAGTQYEYRYRIDAAQMVDSYFDPSAAMFPSSVAPAKMTASLVLSVSEWLPDTDGILVVPTAPSATTSAVTVINALVSNLSAYRANDGTRRFLTDEPLQSFLVTGEKKYISLFTNPSGTTLTDNLRVRTYNTEGNVTGTLIADFAAYSDQVVSISLNDSDLEALTNELGTSIEVAPSAYIDVDFGNYDGGTDTWLQGTETRRFYIVAGGVYRPLPVHWLNRFGAHDTVIVKDDEWERTASTTFQYFEGRLTGRQVLNGRTVTRYNIALRELDAEDFGWLKYVPTAAYIYVGGTGGGDAVQVYPDANDVKTDDPDAKNDIEFALIESVEAITHRT